MKSASRKAKGRGFQQELRHDLRLVGIHFDLDLEDIESRQMGGAGVDIIFSPKAKTVFPFEIEAKNQESLNVTTEFFKHYEKYRNTGRLKLLAHRRNRSEALVTMRWCDFMRLYKAFLILRARCK